ncbi:MAG: RDD family protein [Rhodoferax sp.]|nr:RDD family protein [Rhodoferax sp.]
MGITASNNERVESWLATMWIDAAGAEKTMHMNDMDVSPPYAGFWRRLGAGTVDLIVLAFFATAFGKVAAISKDAAYVLLPVLWAITASYTVVMHARYGATWGKMLCGIRVIHTDGRLLGWSGAFARSAVDLVFTAYWLSLVVPATFALPPESFRGQSWGSLFHTIKQDFPASFDIADWTMVIWAWSEFLTMMFNKRRRAIHDFIAGTVVVIRPEMSPAEEKRRSKTLRLAAAAIGLPLAVETVYLCLSRWPTPRFSQDSDAIAALASILPGMALVAFLPARRWIRATMAVAYAPLAFVSLAVYNALFLGWVSGGWK